MGMCLGQWSGRYKSTREKQILYNPRQLEEREFVMGRQQQHTHIQFSGEWPMETFGFVKLRITDEAWDLSARSNSPHEDRPCGSQSLYHHDALRSLMQKHWKKGWVRYAASWGRLTPQY